jgi:hypothetical protein
MSTSKITVAHSSIALPAIFSMFTLATALKGQVGGQVDDIFLFGGERAGAHLGTSVAGAGDVDGDGVPDLIVGEPDEDTIFVASGATGEVIYQFTTSTTTRLGNTVAGLGDIDQDGFDDFIVGAPHDKVDWHYQAGSAFVFSGATGAVIYHFVTNVEYDRFPDGLSSAGDVDGDGYLDILVGNATAESIGGWGGGANVFSGATGSIIHGYSADNGVLRFGHSVSGLGDLNGDGFDDFIIGAPHNEVGIGRVFLYSGATGDLLYEFNGNSNGDGFGYSVTGIGDVDFDGVPDFAVGAPTASPMGVNEAGFTAVYSGATGALLIRLIGDTALAHFGHSVSGGGDVDGDDVPDIIIGAPGIRIANRPGGGATYVYSGATGALITKREGRMDSHYGFSVADVGDINGDGLHDVMAGALYAKAKMRAEAGGVDVFGFQPFLISNTRQVSASAGGVIDLQLDFPSSARKDRYRVLISATGTGPTTYGVDIPLTQDQMVEWTYRGYYDFPHYTNLHGNLDSDGNATASATFSAGMWPGLIGRTYWIAAVANKFGQLPEFSSIAIPIEIVP